ncbi:DUF4259 domain-containing protein [Brevundimonas vitis]|uniref:DUF4259 domain-containing protein n=1 Tax=Brevundimonas vitisensis TaxID=2800818 RepID=A0ABX7BN86_9CAUL|nr:DUF4259 domain-containing protein [Brevundimonas vitisensis]QQQ18711.1 DUF4259 domain-containing protein [Brevundimonas vitisensis]
MGTWGLAAFENDDAGDFLYEIEEAGSWVPAVQAMQKVILTFGYLEAPESQRGLAAATLVAAARSRSEVTVSEDAAALLDMLPPPPPLSAWLAKRTIGRVLNRSELQELWAEGSELEDWRTETRKALKAL